MNSHDNYYIKSLYPLQDGVLNIVKKSGLPFYLTGGTALSRGYFNHRFSDDLDFFVNNENEYARYVAELMDVLQRNSVDGKYALNAKTIRRTETFTQCFITSVSESVDLKIDIVNDVAIHFGEIVDHDQFGRLDGWRNILSNKLAALYRFEPKDVADIWCISKNRSFSWEEVVGEAKEKDGGIEVLAIAEILSTFPGEMIDAVKWIDKPDVLSFLKDLKGIGEDIVKGRINQGGVPG